MTFEELQAAIYQNAVDKGFYEDAPKVGERIALIHSEASELLEHYRNRTEHAPSEKIAPFTNAEEELADIVIRCMDFAQANNLRLSLALEAKHEYNTTRPRKHGKKF